MMKRNEAITVIFVFIYMRADISCVGTRMPDKLPY